MGVGVGVGSAAVTITVPVISTGCVWHTNAYVPAAANVHSPTQPGGCAKSGIGATWSLSGSGSVGDTVVFTHVSGLDAVRNSTLWKLEPVG